MYLSEYLIVLVMIAALAAFAELISYSSGEDRGHKFAVSVILLYSVISPIVPLIESLEEIDISGIKEESGELSGGAYLEVSEDAFREGILRLLFEKWGLEREKTVVSVFGFDFEKMKAERIVITLLGRGAGVDFHEIEKYIEAANLGECEVRYSIE